MNLDESAIFVLLLLLLVLVDDDSFTMCYAYHEDLFEQKCVRSCFGS